MFETVNKETESFVSNIFKTTFGELTDTIFEAVKNRMLEYQVMMFKNNFLTKSFFHRTKPVPLYDFYMPLMIEDYSYKFQEKSSVIDTETCENLFSKSNNVTIIGTAGSGKSTMVKHLIVQAIDSKFALPILIELRELNRDEYKGDINKYILNEVFNYYKISTKDNLIEQALNKGGFLFIFDGYDELNQASKQTATSYIKKIAEKHDKNYHVITSRPFSNVELLGNFSNYQILGLTTDDQIKLIGKLLNDNTFIQERIIKEINKNSSSTYLSFLENPLLLSLFVITFEYNPTLPKKKSLFYEKVFQTLYEKHNSITKVNFSAEFYSNLSEDEFRIVIELFSFITYFKNLYEFTTEDIRKIINEVKKRYTFLNFENKAFIDDALENVCIWFKDGNYYSFCHRSLQEYFTAQFIISLDNSTKSNIYSFLSDCFDDNYNLVELLAEDPDLMYYTKLITPYIQKFLVNNFKSIDGDTASIEKLEKSYSKFMHLINIDMNLSSIYSEFKNKYNNSQFENHKLIKKFSSSENIDNLKDILILNQYYTNLENLIINITEKTIQKNNSIMDFTFRNKDYSI